MRGLNKLYYLRLEIESIRREIANIEQEIKSLSTISSPQLTGMPHGTGISNPTVNYVLKKEALTEKLKERQKTLTDKLIKCESEKIRIEGILDQIEDPEIRAIARMRFIQNMKWEDIGEKMYLERTTCSKKLRRYLEGMDI